MNRLLSITLCILLWCVWPGLSLAVPFTELNPAEQAVLQPFADRWEGFSEERQLRLRKGAQRYQSLTPSERQQYQQRHQQWRQLSPQQRKQIRRQFKTFKALAPEQRKQIRRMRRKFKSMSDQQRRELRRRFQAMSPTERKRFIGSNQHRQAAPELNLQRKKKHKQN